MSFAIGWARPTRLALGAGLIAAAAFAAPAFAVNGGGNPPDYPPISQEGSPYYANAYSNAEGQNCWVQRQVYDRQGRPLGTQNVNVCGSSTN